MSQSVPQKLSGDAADLPKPNSGQGLVAASAIGALIASSCCILPLLLVTLGASGTWIGSLTVLEPYKPFVLAVTFPLLAAGFWQVYRRPATQCMPGTYCANPWATRLTKTALWLVTLLALGAASIDYWGPLLY
ncbi:MAG: mercuric transporter MerT family protein [Pseudohongiellaceae bacterium]